MTKPTKAPPKKGARKPAKARGKAAGGKARVKTPAPAVAVPPEAPPQPEVPPARTRDVIVADALMRMAGGESIRKIALDEKMAFSTLHSWLTIPDLADQYARAREAQAIYWVERALAVASGTDEEQFQRAEEMVKSIANADENDKDRLLDILMHGAIQRDRLHVDTLKWTAAKFYPKQFGEKVDVTSDGQSFAALVAASMKITKETP